MSALDVKAQANMLDNRNNQKLNNSSRGGASVPMSGATSLIKTRFRWFDSVWPEVSFEEDEMILVPIRRHSDWELLEPNISDNPNHTFMLLIEDFDEFIMPDAWRRMPPDGGIPRNVWVGTAFQTQVQADILLPRLLKIRARVLFGLVKMAHGGMTLSKHLSAWRCNHCGRRGEGPRPSACPSGSICIEEKLNPQIHWLVSMETQRSDAMSIDCERNGVAFFDSQSMQVPE